MAVTPFNPTPQQRPAVPTRLDDVRTLRDQLPEPVVTGRPDSIQAEATPLPVYTRRERSQIFEDDEWQTKVRYYDRNGPGIFGAALDLPASTSMLLELVVRRRTPQGWEIVRDDPRFTALLAMWRGQAVQQQTLFSRLVRTLDGPGEGYLTVHNMNRQTNGQPIWWDLAQTTNVTDNRDGTVTIKKRRDATRGDKWHTRLENEWVYHVMTSDPEWAGEAWSSVRRSLPHLEQFRLVMRNISRNLNSQLAMNGVMWAKEIGERTNWPDRMRSWSSRSISDDDDVAAVMPFPMKTPEKPEWVDVGRSDHRDQIEVAELFLKAFAQSSQLPTQMLLEGPGGGTMNHWSSFLEGDHYADYVMAPRWQVACSMIDVTHLRPFMRAARDMFADDNPDDFQVWCLDDRIRRKTDNTERIFEARRLGAVTNAAVAEAAGVSADQVMTLPDGVTDYDLWQATTGATTTPGDDDQVEEGQVGVPDFGESMDRLNRGLQGPPDVVEADTDLRGELAGRPMNPDYWHDLVPA